MPERQSPPPYLESQRRASSAASRSLATSEWPTWCVPGAGSSRATRASAGVISQREAGVTYALTAKEPARLCQMPPPPGPRRPGSSFHRSVADLTASPTSRGKARPTSGAGSASARPISCSGTGRPSLLPMAAAMRCRAAPCGTMPLVTQRATEVLSYRRVRPRWAPRSLTLRASPALLMPARARRVPSFSLGPRGSLVMTTTTSRRKREGRVRLPRLSHPLDAQQRLARRLLWRRAGSAAARHRACAGPRAAGTIASRVNPA